MYIELFILDNFIMDALMLRLACAFCAVPARPRRLMLFSLLGTALALLSLLWAPMRTLPGRFAPAFLLALALPGRGAAAYLRALASVLLAAFITGGLAFALALTDGGGLVGGAVVGAWRLRTALFLAAGAAIAPYLVRRFRMRPGARMARVYLAACGETHKLRGLWDTGARIYEPVSGLPVVAAYVPSLVQAANIPVPAATVTGEAMLFALKPDALLIDGRPSDALVAPLKAKLRGAEAILPSTIFGEAR